MKRVLVLQHVDDDVPAYLAVWLQRDGIAFEVRNTQAGDVYPNDMQGYSALAVLGGYMSANDEWPSLRRAEASRSGRGPQHAHDPKRRNDA